MNNSFESEEYKIFELFKKNWALVTAGDMNNHNACTVSWGSLGTIWTRKNSPGNVATVYIHPTRYTSKFLNEYDYFTISFFDEKHRRALAYMGSHSGRDGNKDVEAGLTPIEVDGCLTYKEACKTLICKKLYGHQFDKDSLNQDIRDYYLSDPKSFPLDENGELSTHFIFVGDILKVI